MEKELEKRKCDCKHKECGGGGSGDNTIISSVRKSIGDFTIEEHYFETRSSRSLQEAWFAHQLVSGKKKASGWGIKPKKITNKNGMCG